MSLPLAPPYLPLSTLVGHGSAAAGALRGLEEVLCPGRVPDQHDAPPGRNCENERPLLLMAGVTLVALDDNPGQQQREQQQPLEFLGYPHGEAHP